jgi:DNA polymerase-3 subunit beta
MQLTIPLKTLKSMVDAVKEAIPKSPPQEVLTNFRLEAKNELFTITATDLKLWLVRREDCDTIKQEGAIALNAKRFSDMVKSFKGEDVSIKVSEGVAIIKCGKSKFNLPIVDAGKYPSMPKSISEQSFAIATDILREGLAATLKLVSNDETKAALTGVNLSEFDEVLEGEDDPTHFLGFAATDGSRGSTFRSIHPRLGETNLNVTVPARSLKEIAHITQAETEVRLVNNHIWFNTHALTIISPLIAQPFPPLRSHLTLVRKAKQSGAVKCDRKELVDSLKTVSALCEGELVNYLTDITVKDDNLVLVSDEQVGRVEETLPCDIGMSGFSARFNIKYLQHILDTTRSKMVKLEVYEGTRSLVMVSPCDGTDQESFLTSVVKPKPIIEDEDDEED